MSTPSPYLGSYPLESAGTTADLFPPVCLRSHWDPTQILRRTLPTQQIALPLDMRPLVKVCRGPTGAPGLANHLKTAASRVMGAGRVVEGPMEYVTSGPAESSPMPPAGMTFPMGGAFYPPGRYAEAIHQESVLKALDRPLGRDTANYIPSLNSTLYRAGATLPPRTAKRTLTELEMPQALLRLNGETCRSINDTAYFQRSGRLFMNPTKQDRYGAAKFYAKADGLPRGEPMMHGGVFQPPLTASAMASARLTAGSFAQPGGASTARPKAAPSRIPAADTYAVGITTTGSAAPVW